MRSKRWMRAKPTNWNWKQNWWSEWILSEEHQEQTVETRNQVSLLNALMNRVMTASESYLAIGLSALVLISVILLRRFLCPACGDFRANIGDWAAVCYTGLQLIAGLASRIRPNAIHYAAPYSTALCLYFAIRLLGRWPVRTAKLLSRILVGFGALLVMTILPHEIQSIHAAATVFPTSVLCSVRGAMQLSSVATKNDVVAVLLCVLPFALVGAITERGKNRYLWIVSTAVAAGLTTAIILSFSRAGYVAMSILLIAVGALAIRGKGVSPKRGFSIVAIMCAVSIGSAIFVGASNAVVATVVGGRNVSQARSTDGRVAIWRDSITEVLAHPLLGNGGGTDGLAALKRLSDPELPFVARNYNGALETLTSSGVVGLTLYGIFLLYPLYLSNWLFRKRHVVWTYAPILALGIIALLVHDLTYASIVTHGLTIVIAWIAIALLQNAVSRIELMKVRSRRAVSLQRVAFLSMVVSVSAFVLSLHLAQAEKHYKSGATSLIFGDTRKARAEFQHAIQMESGQPMFYAADGLAAFEEAMGTSLTANLWSIVPVPTGQEAVLLADAESDYRKAISLVDGDGSFWSGLAWIESFQGKDELAAKSFAHAIQADPNDAMSRIGAGLLNERKSLNGAAIDQYAHAIAVSPRILDSQFFADLRQRDPNTANVVIQHANELANGFPKSPIHTAAIAKLHASLGDAQLARSEYMEALGLLPNLSYTWTNLGILDLESGNRSVARAEFQRALFLDATNRIATNMLAASERVEGNPERAEELYLRTLLQPEISIHALRSWRLYHLSSPLPDDLAPPGFLPYVSPRIKALGICTPTLLAKIGEVRIQVPDVRSRVLAQEKLCSDDKDTWEYSRKP